LLIPPPPRLYADLQELGSARAALPPPYILPKRLSCPTNSQWQAGQAEGWRLSWHHPSVAPCPFSLGSPPGRSQLLVLCFFNQPMHHEALQQRHGLDGLLEPPNCSRRQKHARSAKDCCICEHGMIADHPHKPETLHVGATPQGRSAGPVSHDHVRATSGLTGAMSHLGCHPMRHPHQAAPAPSTSG